MKGEPSTSALQSRQPKPVDGLVIKKIADDPALKTKIDGFADNFRTEMQSWNIHKFDKSANNFPLPEAIQARMIRAFYETMDAFYRIGFVPERFQTYEGISNAVPCILLRDDLCASPEMRQYQGNQEEAVTCLVGSVVRKAVDTCSFTGIKKGGRRVNEKYFDLDDDSKTRCR
jgi:hypothetical protein